MALWRKIALGFLLALLATPGFAQQGIDTSHIPRCSPQPLQISDYVLVTRTGASCNATYSATSVPIATASANGIGRPDNVTLTINAGGQYSTVAAPSAITLGTLTTANPYITGAVTSGFYTPGTNIIGVELNAIRAMQWNTLSSGVDYLTVTPGKSGVTPQITIAGSTANQGLNLTGTGTGPVTINGASFSSTGVVSSATWQGTAVTYAYGGLGLTSTPAAGKVPMGSGSGYLLATVTGGTGIAVTTSTGNSTISIATTAGGLPSTTTANQALLSTITAGTTIWSTVKFPSAVSNNAVVIGNANNTYAEIAPCANGVINTNGSNTPGCTNAPTVTGIMTASSFVPTTQTTAWKGTTTSDSASAGYIGEYLSAITTAGQAVTISSTTMTGGNAVSLSLTPGDWDVSATVYYNPGSLTTSTGEYVAITTSSGAVPGVISGAFGFVYNNSAWSAGSSSAIPVPPTRFSLSATTTVYAVGAALFATSTNGVYGNISARRVR